MYDIEKIQRKIVYIRCIDGPNMWKKIKFVKCTIS